MFSVWHWLIVFLVVIGVPGIIIYLLVKILRRLRA
jgi:hypothetical protein